jgi:3-dehydroquinate synthase
MEASMTITCPTTDVERYPMYIGTGILSRAQEAVPESYRGFRPFLITDRNLVDHGHAAKIGTDPASTFVIDPPGEDAKNVRTVTAILNVLDEKGFGRDTLIIALGGGTVGDIAGFVASAFKRGVPVLQIPTTTVAQSDSSIGGKAGVNSDWSKNAIGTFWNPCAILMDVETLKTLDERHYVAGLAESLKHGLIADPAFVEYIETHTDAIKRREDDKLIELAKRNCHIKGTVVERDPYERIGLRFILNFGHTIGHAIETATTFRTLHGESIAIGMLGALHLGAAMNITPVDLFGHTETILRGLALPVRLPEGIDPARLAELMRRDKKAKEGRVRFVFLSEIGRVYVKNSDFAHTANREMIIDACRAIQA